MPIHAIEDKVRRFIDASLLRGEGKDLTSATPLFDYGILDSFSLFRLIAFIDQEFGVNVPLERLQAEDFATIDSISRFVQAQLAGDGGRPTS